MYFKTLQYLQHALMQIEVYAATWQATSDMHAKMLKWRIPGVVSEAYVSRQQCMCQANPFKMGRCGCMYVKILQSLEHAGVHLVVYAACMRMQGTCERKELCQVLQNQP